MNGQLESKTQDKEASMSLLVGRTRVQNQGAEVFFPYLSERVNESNDKKLPHFETVCVCVMSTGSVSFLLRWMLSGSIQLNRIPETEDTWLTVVLFQTELWVKQHNDPFEHCGPITIWATFVIIEMV